ncbi:polyprenyl synthetase family protein [Paratissierella segnis]|uniref:Farnesyl diphosphate synthase n=1 Tax=Paratissierella segnis TaxID=2763679 RepID=A0A926ET76_9FIRM|nr:farnesyl diphosphate synthase [Paratissierella segnis]MBC8588431.1 polyprenyl synthetase family protein [Paratissierella segnis]
MSITRELKCYMDLIDDYLKTSMDHKNSYQKKIYEAMEYSLFTGGKRLRPIIALKAYEIFDANLEKILPFAAAIEMIHTYSLIHDDLPSMDDDDFRRGKPTNHKVFGEAMAILTGDGLLNLAFETMLNYTINNSHSIDEYKCYVRAMEEISIYSGTNGMIGGQVLDVLGGFENMDELKLIYMYRTKTAGLIQASLVSGAIIGGANDEYIEKLRKFGLNLGLAYQIKDDILDYAEDESINKMTYLKYFDLNTCKEEVEILSKKAMDILDSFNGIDIDFFKDLTKFLINRNE